jgi:GTP 3',8-cyclase
MASHSIPKFYPHYPSMTGSLEALEQPGRPAAPAPRPDEGGSRRLIDSFARNIAYLRLSLTDHCNLRCLYCMPKDGQEKLASHDLLTFEELLRLTSLATELGIRKVRLTGGEPLLRRDIISFIRGLTAIRDLRDVRLTTNGVLLPEMAQELYQAGVGKINISLDTMRPERYRRITGVDCFSRVWAGIRLAREAGMAIKINVVALKGTNDDELLDFGRLTFSLPYQVRFIEYMPFGANTAWRREHYLSAREIMAQLSRLAPLIPVRSDHLDGPARIYRYEGARGSLGLISPISSHFCERCNRLRLTSEGKLRSCLFSDQEIDIRKILRAGGSDGALQEALLQATLSKPEGHPLSEQNSLNCHGSMSRIGG